MLGITFKGRCDRKMYWAIIVLSNIILILTYVPIQIFSLSKEVRHNMQQFQQGNVQSKEVEQKSTGVFALTEKQNKVIAFIQTAITIYVIVFCFSYFVKRGHDLGVSGLVTLILFLLPIINFLLMLYYGLAPGEKESNKYGALNKIPKT